VQVAQLDSGAAAASSAGSEESTNMVDVAELMAAVLEDSPSNRLTMLQTSGATSYRTEQSPQCRNAFHCPQTFLSVEFQCRDDVSESK